MAIQDRLYTADDLRALPDDSKRYELVEGRLVEMSPTGVNHGLITGRVLLFVGTFVDKHQLGQVFGAETGFKLSENPDTVYGIDVAFVSKARIQRREDYFVGAPDLAVEVVSPGNSQVEMHEKVRDYFRTGARLVWIVYPRSRTIYVYRSENDVRILHEANTLDGGDVLPGFSVTVRDIFAVVDE